MQTTVTHLDEVRISNIARSADWIATEFNSESSPSTLYSVGSATTSSPSTTIATFYFHPDHLSPRVTTDSSGNGGPRRALTHQLLRAGGASVIGQQGHYPFGESWYAANTTTKYQFTSYERDSESGNDYAQARYHINRLGRFSSPDLLSGTTDDPQSLNRYAYVRNVPTGLIDPTGMFTANPCGAYSNRHKPDAAKGTDASGGPNDDSDSEEEQEFLGNCPSSPWPDPGMGGGGGMDMPPDRVGCIISYQQGLMGYDDLNSCLGSGGPGEQQARGASNGGGSGDQPSALKWALDLLKKSDCQRFVSDAVTAAYTLQNGPQDSTMVTDLQQRTSKSGLSDILSNATYVNSQNQYSSASEGFDRWASSSPLPLPSGTITLYKSYGTSLFGAAQAQTLVHEASDIAGYGVSDINLARAAVPKYKVDPNDSADIAKSKASEAYTNELKKHCN